ncbi:peptide transporter Ptr2p [Diutina catenulata]
MSQEKVVEPYHEKQEVEPFHEKQEVTSAIDSGMPSSSDDQILDGEGYETPEGGTPTAYELKHLRHISEHIPMRCWLVAVVELAERFAYYGLSTPFQNYMQNTPEDHPAGMLGLDQTGATALSYFFQFWCYVTPLLGGWLADTFWGKYWTIMASCIVYVCGMLILFVTSIPSITTVNAATGGYIAGIVLIGIGTGGVKANVSPLIADQVPKTKPVIKITKKGERVVQDPNITIQNVFMLFYLMINIGSMSVIATTELEERVGFWAAFLLPFCFFFIGIAALVLGKNYYVHVPVSDRIIEKTFKVSWIAIKNKFNLDAAKPSVNPAANFPWDDHFVEEMKRAVYACKVFVYFPIYWVVYGQMINNFVSMAGTMDTHAIPNDIMQAVNSFAIILFIPIIEKFIYPFIRRFTPLKPITKITIGFFWASIAMIYAAVLQSYIYKQGPCYDNPLECAGHENEPNNIHVAIQTPCYVFISLSEIFASITGLEYAYTKAPIRMKSFIMSLFLVTNAFGSAIGIALSPVSKNPKLTWLYTGLAGAAFIAGVLFWVCFKHYNYKEEELNMLEADDESEVLHPFPSQAHSHKSMA